MDVQAWKANKEAIEEYKEDELIEARANVRAITSEISDLKNLLCYEKLSKQSIDITTNVQVMT